MSTVIAGQKKSGRQFITFRHGDPDDYQYARYSNTTDPATLFGDEFAPVPEIGLTEFRRTGTIEEEEMNIKLPLIRKGGAVDSFVDMASDGYPFSPIDIWIQTEFGAVSGAGDIRTEFVGHVIDATRNHEGKRGVVNFAISTWKRKFDQKTGVPADSRCPWGLGDKSCGVNIKGLEETGTITSIDGSTVTIGGLSTGGSYNGWYWKHGYVKRDGARMFTRYWNDAAPTVFRLERDMRQAWLGQSVIVVPGCRKTPEVCEDVFDNLPFFGGIGKKTPNENPVFKGKK